MNTKRRIFFFRHGETNWNAANRLQGHSDIDLNEKGRQQAKSLIPILEKQRVEIIISSNLRRAHETASIISNALELPLEFDADLRESNLGQAEGMVFDSVANHFGEDLVKSWRSSEEIHLHTKFPDGETGSEVQTRMFAAVHRWLQRVPHKNVAFSTHGGSMRRVLQKILLPKQMPTFIHNCSVYALEYDEQINTWYPQGFID